MGRSDPLWSKTLGKMHEITCLWTKIKIKEHFIVNSFDIFFIVPPHFSKIIPVFQISRKYTPLSSVLSGHLSFYKCMLYFQHFQCWVLAPVYFQVSNPLDRVSKFRSICFMLQSRFDTRQDTLTLNLKIGIQKNNVNCSLIY